MFDLTKNRGLWVNVKQRDRIWCQYKLISPLYTMWVYARACKVGNLLNSTKKLVGNTLIDGI